MKRRDYCLDNLSGVGLEYSNICRILRNVYKWSPGIIDRLPIQRIFKIFEETEIDHTDEKGNYTESV